MAIAKVTDTCFDTDFTDYLVMVKDCPDASGRWQTVRVNPTDNERARASA